jgi:hypothetical protein
LENKLILTKEKNNQCYMLARLDVETHAVLKEMSVQTGISMVKLISKCVAFALERAVVIDSQENNDV